MANQYPPPPNITGQPGMTRKKNPIQVIPPLGPMAAPSRTAPAQAPVPPAPRPVPSASPVPAAAGPTPGPGGVGGAAFGGGAVGGGAPPAPAPLPTQTPLTGAVLTPRNFPAPPNVAAAAALAPVAAPASPVTGVGGNPAWKRNQPTTAATASTGQAYDPATGVTTTTKTPTKTPKPAKAAPSPYVAASNGNMGGGFVPMPTSGSSSQGSPVTSTNTAGVDPFVQQQINRYNERFTNDPTKQAIEHATLGTMDAAALAGADLKGQMGARGVLNSGAGATFLANRVFNPAQRQAAQNASQIAIDRQKQLDALTLGGTDLMRTPAEIGLKNREMALRQWETTQSDARAKAALELEQKRLADQQAAQWLALTQAGYPTGGGGGGGSGWPTTSGSSGGVTGNWGF